MSELTATATATDELKLTPPDPVPAVAPEKAAGLVPLSTEQKSKLEEPVRLVRRLQHFLAAHVGDLVDLLAEGGRIDVLCDEVVDESIDAFLELRFLFGRQRDEAGGLFGGNCGHGIGRGQLQLVGRGCRRGQFAHSSSFQPRSYNLGPPAYMACGPVLFKHYTRAGRFNTGAIHADRISCAI